jgi:hypothetical protein
MSRQAPEQEEMQRNVVNSDDTDDASARTDGRGGARVNAGRRSNFSKAVE